MFAGADARSSGVQRHQDGGGCAETIRGILTTMSGRYRVEFNKREEGFVVADESCILVEEWLVWDADRVVATCGSESAAREVVAALEASVMSSLRESSVALDVAAGVSAGSFAYLAGREQARAQAAKRSVEIVPEAPRDCYSREAWRTLSDGEKVGVLLRRIDASDQVLIVMSRMLAVAPEAGRRVFMESIGSVFCTGCGDIQRIGEHGHLDACQCQNDE